MAPVNKPLNTENTEVCICMPFSFSSDAVLVEKGFVVFSVILTQSMLCSWLKWRHKHIPYVSPSTKLKEKKYHYVAASSISKLEKFYLL